MGGRRVSPMTKPAANSVMRNTAPLQHKPTCQLWDKLIQTVGHSFEQAAKNATAAMHKHRDRLCLRVLLVFKSSQTEGSLTASAFSMLVCHQIDLKTWYSLVSVPKALSTLITSCLIRC